MSSRAWAGASAYLLTPFHYPHGWSSLPPLQVFAVLVHKTGLTHSDGKMVVIHKKEHHLPLFVVRFSRTATHAAMGARAAVRHALRGPRGGGRGGGGVRKPNTKRRRAGSSGDPATIAADAAAHAVEAALTRAASAGGGGAGGAGGAAAVVVPGLAETMAKAASRARELLAFRVAARA